MFRFFKYFFGEYKEYIVLIFLLISSLSFISVNDHASTKNIRAFFFGTFAVVTSFASDVLNIGDLKDQNQKLRDQNARLMLEVNRLREFGIANEELKKLLGVRDTSTHSLIYAQVISKSFSSSQGTVTINIGTEAGIKPGMPVITSEGLVGIVENCSEDFSIVQTLQNMNLRIAVLNQRSRAHGILRWNGEFLTITNLPKTADVKVGDRFIVSELSSLVMLPLPIGIVTEIVDPEKGIFNDLIIDPFVDFVKIQNLFVLNLQEREIKNNKELNFFNRFE